MTVAGQVTPSNFFGVIMAGGWGSRLAPLTTPYMGKQFLPITHQNRTMIQVTTDRLISVDAAQSFIPASRLFVSTNAGFVDLVLSQLTDIPKENILSEPIMKNTAPAIAATMRHIAGVDQEAVVAILPADHLIQSAGKFREHLLTAHQVALDTQGVVTFGIPPTRPHTGYGYIKRGEEIQDGAFKLERFVEKPDAKTAQRYLDSGEYLWNSGMFVWKATDFLNLLSKYKPGMNKALVDAFGSLEDGGTTSEASMRQFFEAAEKISVDFAVMEPSASEGNVYTIPFATGWSDVGGWESIAELYEAGDIDPPKNVLDMLAEKGFLD